MANYLSNNGINSKIIRLDDFTDFTKPVEDALKEIHPYFHHHEVHSFFQKINEGQENIEKPTWDKSLTFKVKENYSLKDVELLILEGEFALCGSDTYDFLKYSNIRLVLEADDHDIIRWDWERARYLELENLESLSFENFTKKRMQSLSKYRELLDSVKPYADLVISKDDHHKLYLERSKTL